MAAVQGLAGSRLAPKAFVGASRSAPRATARAAAAKAQKFDQDWINANDHLMVIGASLAGWTIPTVTPFAGLGYDSLFNKFHSAMLRELANFPTGPSLDSDFWLYMIVWHVGLFLTMTLGTIGVQGRKQGYFN